MEALANKEGPKFIGLLFNAFHQKERLAILDLVNYFVNNIRSIQAIVSIRCRYALHAMLYMFRNEDRLEILNSLSKADLVALKRLIAAVQKYNVPEYEGSLGLVAEIPEDKLFSDVSNQEEEMRRKIGVIHVDVWCFWEAILPELQKWSDAITEFQQAKAEQNAALESDKVEVEETGKNEVIPEGEKTELWSYQELADHLGLTKAQLNRRKHYLLKTHGQYRETVNGYFIKGSFRAECFHDFQALLNMVKHYNRKDKQKAETLPEAMIEEVASKPMIEEKAADDTKSKRGERKENKKSGQKQKKTVKKVVEAAKKQSAKVDGLVGVKALEKLVAKWIEMLSDATAKREQSQQLFQEASDAERAESDPVKRTPLLDKMREANAALVQAMEDEEKLQELIKNANDALHQFQDAENMIKEAEAKKRQASDAITKMLANAK